MVPIKSQSETISEFDFFGLIDVAWNRYGDFSQFSAVSDGLKYYLDGIAQGEFACMNGDPYLMSKNCPSL